MNKKGFSLIELMVAIVVLGMILVVVYGFFFSQEKTLRRQRQWSELNIKGRKASTYIAKELRSIGYSASDFGGGDAFGIINGTATGISYSHDIYGAVPGQVDNPADIHSITLVVDTLKIDGDRAIDRVASLEFVYTDTTGTEVVPIVEVNALGVWQFVAPIETIKYTLRLYSTSPLYPDTVEYSGLVSLRNERP